MIVSSGTELWEEYRKLSIEHPEIIVWRVDKLGNYLPDSIPEENQNKAFKYQYALSLPHFQESNLDYIYDFVETLEDKYRNLVEYVYFDRLSIAETARKLNITRPTVYSWWLIISGMAVDHLRGVN